ncbi:related to NADH2 dehydrogenase (ubiquinone) complex I 13K-A chain precursor [Phialocephala subalpina]|uniref:Related to NADH2 dehydrogenase (Ubiquinone) complex I 13K-A chain n=1 Tax=Phialocephala subalpina TaxID=576137 RepID=A0A1L7X978_9HELO|nr:related to NADH2 dehydrogenase (ubiquinone) complex I 13K-A chain precursor [Phialocephala subalpina]
MLSTTRSRAILQLSRRAQPAARRAYAFSANDTKEINVGNTPKEVPNVSKSNELPIETPHRDAPLQENAADAEKLRVQQAPNRAAVWSRSQNPRAKAMSGPRFEQTIMELQPAPLAAIDLIHKQPVRWTHERVVACDGGGGPLGHPRIFINTDKPQICMCTYCGLPFANEHHRAHLESLPDTAYPLAPRGDTAEIPESQRITDEALGQR